MQLEISERYKQIEGYDEYFITDTGKVYTYRTRPVGWRGLRQLSPKGKNNPNRYLSVCLSNNGDKKYHQIHTLVAKHFCDGYFPNAEINHKDANIHNNHYTNLEWVTHQDNIHKSYTSSGIDAVRNYSYFDLIDPTGEILATFKGRNAVEEYLIANNIDASCSSLKRHGKSRGYQLIKH